MFPLHGVRVVEVAEFIYAPAAVATLADWGAEVIKVELPEGGDRLRNVLSFGTVPVTRVNHSWHQCNRGKKSVAIDLRTEQGREVLYELVAKCDVFVTSFLAKARERMRIEYEDLVRVNPKLVYVRMNGYGSRGAEVNRPGYDFSAFWGRGGFAASLADANGSPAIQRPGFGDQTGGMFGAGATAAALFSRERTGKSVLVDLSLLASAMWVNALDILSTYYSDNGIPKVTREEMANPLFNTYQAGDGRWLQLAMPQTDPFWPGFCKALSRPDLEHDQRFADHVERLRHNKELIEVLDEILKTKSLDEWSALFEENGCVWGPLQQVADLLSDPQVLANNYLVTVDDLKLVASPPQFDLEPVRPASGAPELGQHTEEVLLSLGYSWDKLAALKAAKIII